MAEMIAVLEANGMPVAAQEAASRRTALTEYLTAHLRARFDWQTSNCASFVALWLHQRRGVRVGFELMFAARRSTEAQALIYGAGFDSLSGLAAALLARAGIAEYAEAAEAAAGDIGVVLGIGAAGDAHETLAIHTGSAWATLAPRGLTIGKGRALRAWRI